MSSLKAISQYKGSLNSGLLRGVKLGHFGDCKRKGWFVYLALLTLLRSDVVLLESGVEPVTVFVSTTLGT